MFFKISTVTTIVAGTMFLMWLGEQITQRGIGNGISLIIFSGIVAEIPRALVTTFELGRTGAISTAMIIFYFYLTCCHNNVYCFYGEGFKENFNQLSKKDRWVIKFTVVILLICL